MTLPDKRFPLKFEKVTRIEYADWPQDWLQECDMGELLLGPGSRAKFGILCIDNSGAFVNLTPDQIYRGAPIPWNDPASDIHAVCIREDRIQIVKD